MQKHIIDEMEFYTIGKKTNYIQTLVVALVAGFILYNLGSILVGLVYLYY